MTALVGLVIAIAGAIVLAELALRVLALVNPSFRSRLRMQDLLAVKIAPMGEHGFRQKPNTSLRYENGSIATANALGYRGPAVSIPKPPGTTRIVLIGGSTTHGWNVNDDQTVDAAMRRQLAQRFPGRRFEVVNLAFDGYDSFQEYERVRLDALRFEPDLIILNTGINDVRNARYPDLQDPDPRTLLWRNVVESLRALEARGSPTLKTRLKHHSHLVQFVSVVRTAWHVDQGAAVRATIEHPNLGAFDYYERNIRRTAALAHERGIPLLLSTSPSAIPTSFSPDAVSPRDYWIRNAALTQELREGLGARLRRVADELAGAGQRVGHVQLRFAPNLFSDDAHFTPEGNEALAREFIEAAIPLLQPHGVASTQQ
jgi:lysophospholipase L1-like esterase